MTPPIIEHFAVLVRDPQAVAQWYCRNMDMKVLRKGGPPGWGHFLADSTGRVLFEIYANEQLPTPDYASMDGRLLHLAFVTDNVAALRKKLLAAGAAATGEVGKTDAGDDIADLRDPWGLAIQLVRRVKSIK